MSSASDLACLLTEAAAESPDRLAVVEAGGRAATWAELDDEVSRVAGALGTAGILAGHRVMIASGNRLEFIGAYLATLRAQAVAVPVNPGSTVEEFTRMLADSGARVVFADNTALETVRAALGRAELADLRPVRLVVIGEPARDQESSYDDFRSAEPVSVPPLPDAEKLAVLLYTSGTSGAPRAAMLSHRALLANVDQVARVEPPMLLSADVVLGVLPLFHVYGLNAVLGGVLRHRAKLVLADRFDPEGTIDLIEDEACSVVPVAPPVFAHWLGVDALRERLGPVRLVLSGSAPLPAAVIHAFEDLAGVPVHQGYGLTEASPVVTSTLRSTTPKAGSVGTALAGIDIRLVDDFGAPHDRASQDDPGEIQIRGANLFSGYWPDGADGPDESGWWSTGDVGFLDEDGDLYLVDRVRDLIIVSGFNVYPIEVETVIGSLDEVRAVAVVGEPDEETGESVVAHVVGADGSERDAVVAAVQAKCVEYLAAFKRPTAIHVVDTLPRTVTGKVRKSQLRGAVRRQSTELLG